MQFDTTINLGTVLAASAVILTLLGLHTKNVERYARIETMLRILWKRSGVEDSQETQFFPDHNSHN